ncbi:MAG: hypothetical protein ABUL62_32025 [Myxococcales bacterium]
MKTNLTLVVLLPCFALACSSDADLAAPTNGGAAGAGATSGGFSQSGAAGSHAGMSNGGAAASAVGGGGGGGPPGVGGGAGASPSAGAPAVAGASGSGMGGSIEAGGTSGAGGGASLADVAKALDGVRVDDACSGTAVDTSTGAVCQHVTLTASGGSKYAQSATIAGTAGTTYDVTLRIRGVVEPTSVTGGTRADTSTFQYRSMAWRKVPYTIGGSVANTTDADYTQWHISVESPKGDYYLNDYQKTGHYIFKLDYEVTVQMAANTKVTLDGVDRNERQIVNYEKYAIDGIPGSVNFGQFVQVNVLSVKPH